MLLKDTDIYPFIKDMLDMIPTVHITKNSYVSTAGSLDTQIYYILEGEVKIQCTSITGKRILVDELSENEFVGHISNMRRTSFHSDIKAFTNVKLLCLRDDIMYKLMQNCEFSSLFYYKTSKRIYLMYKKSLTNELFSQREILAYYILNGAKKGELVYKSMYHICESLNISRRNLYNVLNSFIEEGIIEKIEASTIIINDENCLMKISEEINSFLGEDE